MKRVIIALMLNCVLISQAQNNQPCLRFNTDPPKFETGTLRNLQAYKVLIGDPDGDVAYKKEGEAWTVIDSMRTLKVFLRNIDSMYKNIDRMQTELDLAREILHYMTTDGAVTDRKKFAAAVKQFVEFKTKK